MRMMISIAPNNLKDGCETGVNVVSLDKHPAKSGKQKVVENDSDRLACPTVLRAVDANKIDGLGDDQVDA
jgi:hypothetical protein